MKRKLKVNDFFCGCGGMGIAFKNAGYEIAGAWDFDKYAVKSYRANVIIEAVLLYCHANFGSPDNQTQLLASYNAMCTKIKGGGYHREANKTID